MHITQTKYIAELKMREGQTKEQLNSELSEFEGMVLAVCNRKSGRIAACGFTDAHFAAEYMQLLIPNS